MLAIARIQIARGFTLVEVLVTMFILGLGLVGMLQLDVFGMRKAAETQFNSIAMLSAYELSERIRSNASAGDLYTVSLSTNSPAPQPDVNCYDTAEAAVPPCAQADLVANDLYEFWTRLHRDIPTAEVAVTFTEPDSYEVQITWEERSVAGSASGTTERQIKVLLQ